MLYTYVNVIKYENNSNITFYVIHNIYSMLLLSYDNHKITK